MLAAGEFEGTLAIGEVRVTARGGRDGFVARLDSRGAPVWVKTFGGPGADRINAIAPAGEAIVIGGEAEPGFAIAGARFDSAARPDGFVARLDASGEPTWATPLGATRYASVASVAAVDAEILAAGHFAGSIERGEREVYSAGNQDAFVARYTKGGELRWLRRAGGPGADFATAVVAGPGGEVAFAGSVMDGATFGATELETIGDEPDAFVARLDQSGAPIWVRQLGGAGADGAAALAIDGGSIICAGRFARDLSGVGSPLTSSGESDGFVAWLSLAGQPTRATSVGGEGADWLSSIAVGTASAGSSGDGVIIGGGFTGSAGGDLQSAGAIDGLVGKLAGSQARWRRPIGGSADDAVNAVAGGLGGQVAIAASFRGRFALDRHRLDAGDQTAAVVALLEP